METTNQSLLKKKLKIPIEIEAWVLNSEFINNKIENDILDLKYASNLETKASQEELNNQRLKVLNVLKEMRIKKQSTKTKLDEALPDVKSAYYIDTNAFNRNKKEKCFKMLNIEKLKRQKNSFKKIEIGFNQEQRLEKFRSLNSGQARLMPGILPKNIAIERIMFRDLFKLSKQRYAAQKNTDLLKREFLTNQKRKGLSFGWNFN